MYCNAWFTPNGKLNIHMSRLYTKSMQKHKQRHSVNPARLLKTNEKFWLHKVNQSRPNTCHENQGLHLKKHYEFKWTCFTSRPWVTADIKPGAHRPNAATGKISPIDYNTFKHPPRVWSDWQRREVDNLIFPGFAAQGIFNRPTEAVFSWSETNEDWKRRAHANWNGFEQKDRRRIVTFVSHHSE